MLLAKYKSKLSLSFKILHNISASEKNLIFIKEYKDNPKDITDMKEIIEREVPIAIKEKMLGISVSRKSNKVAFWTGIGLEVLGAGVMVAGYMKHQEMQDAHEKYKGVESNFGGAWDKVESSRKTRDALYIAGGVLWLRASGCIYGFKEFITSTP